MSRAATALRAVPKWEQSRVSHRYRVMTEESEAEILLSVPWIRRLASAWITFGFRYRCSYCGEDAACLDHVIPWSWLSCQNRGSGAGHKPGIRTWACTQCNNLLGSKLFSSFSERARFVNRRLNVKYRRIVRGAMWTPTEIGALEGMLRTHVAGKQKTRDHLTDRLDWIYTEDFRRVVDDARTRCSLLLDAELEMRLMEFFADEVLP